MDIGCNLTWEIGLSPDEEDKARPIDMLFRPAGEPVFLFLVGLSIDEAREMASDLLRAVEQAET